MKSVKTSISLPEPAFAAIEARAEEQNVSRSAIVLEAVRRNLEREAANDLTARMTAALAEGPELTAEDDAWLRASWKQQSEWHKGDRW